jgi:arylsulfatase A-like enzyme
MALAAGPAFLIGGCGVVHNTGQPPARAPSPGRAASAAPTARPNIVFVLTDDLSTNLLRFMPRVSQMERNGLSFEDYFVSDSLCCPLRSSIFTGNLPYDTGVYANFGRSRGFAVFHQRGEERHTFALALKRVGYRTAMMGKYLNGYMSRGAPVSDGSPTNVPDTYVPPGWDRWDVGGFGYPEFDYRLNQNGHLRRYGRRPADYLTDVLAAKGAAFINSAAAGHHPFFLELATFAPHSPYVPAPRNAHDFPGLHASRPPSFDVLPTHAPQWLADHPRLTRRQLKVINRVFRRRAQSVEGVDRLIARIESTLLRDGVASHTYLVFSSDNGPHGGQYRLMPGKLTAFDTDIRVPLIVTRPHVPAGARSSLVTENIDLAKTFAAIGGAAMPGDGHSLLPLLRGQPPLDWRNAALIEHRGGPLSVLDPDFQQPASGNPTTYEAMRTDSFLYVEYADGEREFYDLRRDPFELHNIESRLRRGDLRRLHAALKAMQRCQGGEQCWRATHIGSLRPSPPNSADSWCRVLPCARLVHAGDANGFTRGS